MKSMYLILLIALVGCSTNNIETKKNIKMQQGVSTQLITGPKALVYKTKKNYNNLVPVILSECKSEIVSYPHPSDIKVGDNFQTPTILNNEYLLDNRGIGLNVGFLKMTYDEYYRLKEVPQINILYEI